MCLKEEFFQGTNYAEQMADKESHDVIWEISNYTLKLDLLLESKMIEEYRDGGKNEIANGVNGIAMANGTQKKTISCQTDGNFLCLPIAECRSKTEEGLLKTYLEKKLNASSVLHHRRRNSRKFEFEEVDFSRPELDALEAELMLEKYLRYQHGRRNRRYLSNVRAIEDERTLNTFYKEECNRLKTELQAVKSKLEELARSNVEQTDALKKQLIELTSKFNSEVTTLKLENTDLKKIQELSVRQAKKVTDELEAMKVEKSDVLSENRNLREKLEHYGVIQVTNESLKRRINQLQNQLFIVSEIRSYQSDALNALKPFCSKEDKTHPYIEGTHPLFPEPHITNLEKLNNETARKLKIYANDRDRLQTQVDRCLEENKNLKEKHAKQKDLTEKTTHFWEQKYSGLEKTCQVYKNNYREVSQQLIKLKREWDSRRRL